MLRTHKQWHNAEYERKTSVSKKHDNLFEKIIDPANVDDAYKKTQKAKLKYKISALQFSENLTVNLEALRQRVASGRYKPGDYHSFMVYEPKERLIFAPCFEDKIVQHMINNVLREIYEPCFIYDSYACIRNKGTQACVGRINSFQRMAKWEYGENAYIVKADISKFFYSIDREILKRLLRKKIKCKGTLWLLDSIIDSSPGEIGLPLGNLTSQLLANIYLNHLDQYCKRVLCVKFYVRYADDIVMIARDKQCAKDMLDMVRSFANESLKLSLHPEKSRVFPLLVVNAIGFKNFGTHKLLRNDCKKKVKRKIKAMPRLIIEGRMSKEKANQMLNSWLGHARFGSSHNFVMSLLTRFEHIKMNNKNLLQIVEDNYAVL